MSFLIEINLGTHVVNKKKSIQTVPEFLGQTLTEGRRHQKVLDLRSNPWSETR